MSVHLDVDRSNHGSLSKCNIETHPSMQLECHLTHAGQVCLHSHLLAADNPWLNAQCCHMYSTLWILFRICIVASSLGSLGPPCSHWLGCIGICSVVCEHHSLSVLLCGTAASFSTQPDPVLHSWQPRIAQDMTLHLTQLNISGLSYRQIEKSAPGDQ